jgi:hypothetical protein
MILRREMKYKKVKSEQCEVSYANRGEIVFKNLKWGSKKIKRCAKQHPRTLSHGNFIAFEF